MSVGVYCPDGDRDDAHRIAGECASGESGSIGFEPGESELLAEQASADARAEHPLCEHAWVADVGGERFVVVYRGEVAARAGVPDEDDRRPGSIGKPLDGVAARIVDDEFVERPPVEEGPVDEKETNLDEITGELVIAGPNVMQGYYERPEANADAFTEADGKRWFHTGDIGYYDEDGFFYTVDRKKHMINTAGYRSRSSDSKTEADAGILTTVRF